MRLECVSIIMYYDKSQTSQFTVLHTHMYTQLTHSHVLTQLGVNQHKTIYNTQILKLYTLCSNSKNSESYKTLQGDFNMYTYIQELVLGCHSFEWL